MIDLRASMLILTAIVVLQAAPLLAVAAKAPVAKHAAPAASGNVTRAQLIAQDNTVFDRADTNHDGFMSRTEFAARMAGVINASRPASKAEAQGMIDSANRAFDDADTDHDGKLSRAEGTARPLRAFDMMDTNHDGVLTVAEKRAAYETGPAIHAGPIQPTPDH